MTQSTWTSYLRVGFERLYLIDCDGGSGKIVGAGEDKTAMSDFAARMLIAQVTFEDLILITTDGEIRKYAAPGSSDCVNAVA